MIKKLKELQIYLNKTSFVNESRYVGNMIKKYSSGQLPKPPPNLGPNTPCTDESIFSDQIVASAYIEDMLIDLWPKLGRFDLDTQKIHKRPKEGLEVDWKQLFSTYNNGGGPQGFAGHVDDIGPPYNTSFLSDRTFAFRIGHYLEDQKLFASSFDFKDISPIEKRYKNIKNKELREYLQSEEGQEAMERYLDENKDVPVGSLEGYVDKPIEYPRLKVLSTAQNKYAKASLSAVYKDRGMKFLRRKPQRSVELLYFYIILDRATMCKNLEAYRKERMDKRLTDKN